MTDVVSVFEAYSKLRCLDLRTELPGCEFDGKIEGIYYFTISVPDSMVTLLTVCLGDYKFDSKGRYYYQDGTVAKFVASKKWYEFRRYKKPIARVRIA